MNDPVQNNLVCDSSAVSCSQPRIPGENKRTCPQSVSTLMPDINQVSPLLFCGIICVTCSALALAIDPIRDIESAWTLATN